jgi:hypothetical protein
MTPTIAEQMHDSHRHWESENALHRDELRAWQYELYQLITGLPRLKEALEQHEKILADHAQHIWLYDKMLRKEEHIVAGAYAKTASEDQQPLSSRVTQEHMEHDKQNRRHEQIKEHHHDVMTHWLALLKSLDRCDVVQQQVCATNKMPPT